MGIVLLVEAITLAHLPRLIPLFRLLWPAATRGPEQAPKIRGRDVARRGAAL